MILGYRLRELRKEKNLSQADLGKLLGVSKVSVSGYEKGTRMPSLDILILMLDVFSVNADYILGRELNAVCEDDDNVSVNLSIDDVEIIRAIRKRPSLYNKIAENPGRFFATIYKNNI